MGQVDNMVIAPAVQRTGLLDPVKDLTPVIQVASSPFLFMAATDGKYKKLGEWVADAKANPGKMTYGTAGYGTFTHLAVELLQNAGNFKAVQVPYKGAVARDHRSSRRAHPDGGVVDRLGHAAHPGRQGARARRDVGGAQSRAA